jgi:hypothetical protein
MAAVKLQRPNAGVNPPSVEKQSVPIPFRRQARIQPSELCLAARFSELQHGLSFADQP